MKKFIKEGEPFVWLTGAALALTLLFAATLILVILTNGLGVFWPSPVARAELKDGSLVLGEIVKREAMPSGQGERLQFKTGNRDLYGRDFRWVDGEQIAQLSYPSGVTVLEREEYGNFYGTLLSVAGPTSAAGDASPWEKFDLLQEVVEQKHAVVAEFNQQLAALNQQMEALSRKALKLGYQGAAADSPELLQIEERRALLQRDFSELSEQQAAASAELNAYTATFADVAGSEKSMSLAEIVRHFEPNDMGVFSKSWHYLGKLKELIFGQPRESNTEGGLFPAIFGTVMLIFLMTLVTFPLGVIAAVYLREYAKDGLVVRLVRIAVNNLAGIPSIVYGIFGLTFFVYGIGSSLDALFFPERLPNPTFGTGGILWASLTLALLTVPVVIVSTEEALGAIPAGVREGSLALGATKFQTLLRTLLPMASPGIMTGLILAMARAAGEVAPLMITGVVKLAPALPLDGQFPYLHLDRKFMHLGFHIYDIGFQSPNVEAAKPMVFVTTLLLVLIVLVMSSIAIMLRNRMKKRYTYGTF